MTVGMCLGSIWWSSRSESSSSCVAGQGKVNGSLLSKTGAAFALAAEPVLLDLPDAAAPLLPVSASCSPSCSELFVLADLNWRRLHRRDQQNRPRHLRRPPDPRLLQSRQPLRRHRPRPRPHPRHHLLPPHHHSRRQHRFPPDQHQDHTLRRRSCHPAQSRRRGHRPVPRALARSWSCTLLSLPTTSIIRIVVCFVIAVAAHSLETRLLCLHESLCFLSSKLLLALETSWGLALRSKASSRTNVS